MFNIKVFCKTLRENQAVLEFCEKQGISAYDCTEIEHLRRERKRLISEQEHTLRAIDKSKKELEAAMNQLRLMQSVQELIAQKEKEVKNEL